MLVVIVGALQKRYRYPSTNGPHCSLGGARATAHTLVIFRAGSVTILRALGGGHPDAMGHMLLMHLLMTRRAADWLWAWNANRRTQQLFHLPWCQQGKAIGTTWRGAWSEEGGIRVLYS